MTHGPPCELSFDINKDIVYNLKALLYRNKKEVEVALT